MTFFPRAVRNAGKVCLGGMLNSSQVTQQNTHTLVTMGAFFSADFALFGNRAYLDISEFPNVPKWIFQNAKLNLIKLNV